MLSLLLHLCYKEISDRFFYCKEIQFNCHLTLQYKFAINFIYNINRISLVMKTFMYIFSNNLVIIRIIIII